MNQMMRKTIIHHRLPVIRRFRLFNRYLFVSLPHDAGPHIGRVRSCQGVADILGLKLDGKACEINREIVARFMLAHGMANSMTSPCSAGGGWRRS